MTTLLNDVRYGLRLLRKSPGFTIIAVVTMATGIAANTTVFSWMRSVLLNPLPGTGGSSELVWMETATPSGEHVPTSFLDYRDVRDRARLFNGIAISQMNLFSVGEGERTSRAWGEMVSGNFFDVLRVKPGAGRFFSGAELSDAVGAHPVAVISYAFWQNRYRGNAAVIGSTLRINQYPFTIIGVAPPAFHGSMVGLDLQIWTPATMYGHLVATGDWPLRDRKTRMWVSLARLQRGVSIERAREELKSISARLAETEADTNQGLTLTTVPLSRGRFGTQNLLAAPLGILMGISAVVLLIVCANVANLLLARATARHKEFGIRMALGAKSGTLVRQLLVEALLLAGAGSAVGLIAAAWLRGSLKWLVPATAYPVVFDSPLDFGVLSFTVGIAVLAAVAAGLAPALRAANPDVQEVLQDEGRGGTASAGTHRLRGVLVVAEVALSVIALIGAGLFLKSFDMARAIHPGFDPRNVAMAQFSLSTAGYSREQSNSFCRRLNDRLAAQPGVERVAYADYVPLGFGGDSWEDLEIEGFVASPNENMKIYRDRVSPGFFDTMRIPLRKGRDFTDHDDEKTLPVMIVNEAFVRRFLPNQNAIGRKVNGWGRWFTIVGIVGDSKYHSLTEAAAPFFYIPIRQIYRPEYPVTFLARVNGNAEQAVGLVQREARGVDPGVAMFNAMQLEEFITAALFAQRVAATLLGVLGALSVLLAGIGLYSVMAYSVTQRRHEIGIRMALGAEPGAILRLVVGQGMRFALMGLAAGSLCAAVLAHGAASALVSVSPVDPIVYAGVALFVALVSALASWLPARRAMRVDPMNSLRAQ